MLYTVCLWSVRAFVRTSEIPSWFKSIVFGKAACCTPLRIGSIAVDMFMLLIVFSNYCVNWVTARELSLFFRFIFPQRYFAHKQAHSEGHQVD